MLPHEPDGFPGLLEEAHIMHFFLDSLDKGGRIHCGKEPEAGWVKEWLGACRKEGKLKEGASFFLIKNFQLLRPLLSFFFQKKKI